VSERANDASVTPARPQGILARGIDRVRSSATALAERTGRRRLLAFLFLLVIVASPWPALTILALLAYLAVAWNDPGWTVALLPLTAPFAYQPKGFPSPRSPDSTLLFPAIELLLLIALATTALHLLRHWRREATAGTGAAALLDLWDGAKKLVAGRFGLQATALALIGTVSLLTIADRLHLRESIREYRTVVIEPVLYFFLARAWLRDRELRATAIGVFIGGAALVSLLAIGQVLTGRGWWRSRGCGARSGPMPTRTRWPSISCAPPPSGWASWCSPRHRAGTLAARGTPDSPARALANLLARGIDRAGGGDGLPRLCGPLPSVGPGDGWGTIEVADRPGRRLRPLRRRRPARHRPLTDRCHHPPWRG
jgi:hypothetical protein